MRHLTYHNYLYLGYSAYYLLYIYLFIFTKKHFIFIYEKLGCYNYHQTELSYSVNKVCQFMASPLESNWVAVKRILRYLKGTVFHGLHLIPAILGQSYSIRALCDADWASDVLMTKDQLLGLQFSLALISYLVVLQATSCCQMQH